MGIRSIFFTSGRSVGKRLYIWRRRIIRLHSQYYCYKDHPGLGIRSIFNHYSSVSDTFTIGVVGRTRVQISLRTPPIDRDACACVPQITSPWLLRYLNATGSQCTAVYGTDAPKIPPFRGQGVLRIALGWAIDRSFTPITQ